MIKIINLHQLNLDINLGEMTGIKGHSGSGKTTLINILVGLIGTICWKTTFK